MIGIYKITSPTGKVYIGQSTDIGKRLGAYKRLECKSQTRLYNSIVKYDFYHHIFEVIEECAIEQLNIRERYWQDVYDVLSKKGLNCRLTGTDDRSGKVSADSNKKRIQKHRKIILQYSLEGLFIREWSSIKEAGDILGIQRGNIPACCKRRKKSVGGFIWRYKIGDIEQLISVEKVLHVVRTGRSPKSVLQYSKEGFYIREWTSIRGAANYLGIRETGIVSCCKGRNKSSGGFSWKYS